MPDNLISEIASAREAVIRLEAETSEAGHRLSLSREKLRKARGELDTLLQELVSGKSRYPLPGFDPIPAAAAGNGQASPTAAGTAAPLRGRRKAKGATP